jgi:anti-sigma B factor antagonist
MAPIDLVEATDTFTHVALQGKLDAAGVREVDLKLTSQTVARRRPAVIDLTEVEFIGSLGISMLFVIARSLRLHGAGMAVIVGSPSVKGALEMTQIEDVISVVATREEALRALGLA